MKKSFYISTSIPYVNAAPHVGHAEEFVQADIIARYQRLIGNDVFFLSGTDDNALKNVLKAEEAGESVSTYVNRLAALFEELLHKLDISNDDFIRTSVDERHRNGAQKLWKSFKAEDIYKKEYRGLYCVGCEEFKTEKDLVKGECPEHPGKKLEEVSEENYFFKLSNYQKPLEGLFESAQFEIIPESRRNEIVSFIREGVTDISISRSRERARNWGIPVPDDDTQVMYVWVDALSNYINALGYADDAHAYKKFWEHGDTRMHVVGKGITRFHAIYWPALLLSAGLPLPTHILVHGYLTSGGQKMSKTLGNVIDPVAIINEYGADAFRYFIAREVSTFEDSDFTAERFKDAYNGNLVNGLGNLVARVMKLAETHLGKPVSLSEPAALPKEYTDAFDVCDINKVANYIWSQVAALDKVITDTKPFSIVKTDLEEGKKLIRNAVLELHSIARLLPPFLPSTAEKIMTAITTNKMPDSLFPRKA